MSQPLTREQIVEAAEQAFRRYGPQKTNVVDIARALGVTHASVYRHFESKDALRDAVVAGWLDFTSGPLEAALFKKGPPDRRLRLWFDTLVRLKREYVKADPELFAVARTTVEASRDVVRDHINYLVTQIATIIADGVASGDFAVDDVETTARAMLSATSRFHDPMHAAEWDDPGIDKAYDAVIDLLMAGIGTGRAK